MTRKLTVDTSFSPCPVADGDELFPNGIFKFKITKMREVIQNNPDVFTPENIAVGEFKCYSSVNESHVNTVDVSQPVIMAEISPGKYNLIDGNPGWKKRGGQVSKAYWRTG